MKLTPTILITLLFFSCFAYSNQKVDIDSPEGWAMAFMTTSAQNLGQMQPHSVNVRDISISAELSSIPHLSREQQKIGFGGYKDEVVQQGMKQNYDHHLSLKKKDFIIQGLKSFNDFQKKTAVTKKPTIKKTDGLSDTERKVLKSLK